MVTCLTKHGPRCPQLQSAPGAVVGQVEDWCVRMSLYGSQGALNRKVGSKADLAGGGGQYYAQSDVVHSGGNGYESYADGYTYTFSKSSVGGLGSMRYGFNSNLP